MASSKMQLQVELFALMSALAVGVSGCGGSPSGPPNPFATSTGVSAGSGSGGGSGSPSPSPSPSPAPGNAAPLGYDPGTARGGSFNTLVLPNEFTYIFYGTGGDGTIFVPTGFVWGQASGSSGSFFISKTVDVISPTATNSGTLNAIYSNSGLFTTSISGTLQETTGLGDVSFTGAAPTSGYNFQLTPVVSAEAGAWVGTDILGSSTNLTVTAGGSFTGIDGGGCTFTGTLTPAATGYNYFQASITFGPMVSCQYPNQTLTGVGIDLILQAGGSDNLVIMLPLQAIPAGGYILSVSK